MNQANAAGNHQAVVPEGKLCAGDASLGKGFDLARDD
jgi:chitin-binding protein